MRLADRLEGFLKYTYSRKLISGSIFFNPAFYAKKAGLRNEKKALHHFLTTGWKQDSNPSPYFDVSFYKKENPDVAMSGMNPLVHYLRWGVKDGRSPSPLFDRETFLEVHPEVLSSGADAARACLDLYGCYHWEEIQAQDAPHVSPAEKDGCRELFDEAFYLSFNPDVLPSGEDAFEHFMRTGYKEDRDPSPDFDVRYYKDTHLGAENENPLVNFIKTGRKKRTTPESYLKLEMGPPNESPSSSSICVHAHCYYPSLVDEMARGFANLPENARLVVTVTSLENKTFVEQRLRSNGVTNDLSVLVVENRGRDIAPFLVGAREIWQQYDYVLHVHTKHSPHISWGDEWRHYLYDQLLGSKGLVQAVMRTLDRNPDIGALYPNNFRFIKPFVQREQNAGKIGEVLALCGIPYPHQAEYDFPAGSMCWYRTTALEKLTKAINSLDFFEPETGQVDGTLAHALERVIPFSVRASGYKVLHYGTSRRHALQYPISASRLAKRRKTTDWARHLFQSGRAFLWRKIPRNKVTYACYNLLKTLLRKKTDQSFDPELVTWPRDTPLAARRPPLPLHAFSKVFRESELDVHWIIPAFPIAGAGGHMTIFRMIRLLESFGHRQTVWIQNGTHYGTEAQAKNIISGNYTRIGDNVRILFLPDDIRQLSGDVLIATDCWTAFPASQARFFKERFYFVQDYEPAFHPMGENWLLADGTYSFGFSTLCAGAWLDGLMRSRGCWSRKWELSADPDVYSPAAAPDDRSKTGGIHIAFYARANTPRRAVGLGLVALELLAKRGRRFTAHLFGENNLTLKPHTFTCVRHGVLDHERLAALYRKADVGLVFSSTNYSLIPLEMAACGLPVVELDVPSTRAVFTNNEVTFAEPTPYGIADAIERMLDDTEARKAQVERARAFVTKTSWEKSARTVEAALVERLKELDFVALESGRGACPAVGKKPKVSVFVPTYNAGERISDVLRMIQRQKCDFAYDVLVIDSGSTDDTPARVEDFKKHGVRLETIEKSSFQHGRTRNLGIAMTEGDYIAILTQDACPKDETWLSRLIAGFSFGDRVAGVTGRHEAYPEHDAFTHRDMLEHFAALNRLPRAIDLKHFFPPGLVPGGPQWRMQACFYSDNNSAMARSVWRQLPYPEVEWGEDQLWADMALQAGFQKAYAHDAVVYHSHASDDATLFKTAMTEGEFWAAHFGIQLVRDEEAALAAANERDRLFAKQNAIPGSVTAARLQANAIVTRGRFLGWEKASPAE